MMLMNLLFILDDLTSFLGIACNIGDSYWQLNFLGEFSTGC